MEKVKLGQLTNIKTGRLDVNAENPNGKYPFFTCSKNHTYIDEYAFDGESVLVAGNGDLNVKYYNGKFNAYQRTYVIQANENLNGKFLYYFLDSYVEKLREQSIGGVIKYIKLGNLTDAEIPLPNLATQQRIAAILDQADAIIQNNRAIVQKYDALTQSLFLDMFGDPVKNEKGWETKTIEQLVSKNKNSIKRGPFGGALKKEIFVEEGYLVYEQYHALNNDFSMERYFIDDKKFEELKGFEVKPKDIIISCSGVYLGKLAIVPKNAKKGIINQALLKVTIDESIMTNDFFVFHFSHKNFREKYFDANRGAGIPNFPPMSEFKKFPFIAPPIELQNQFAERVAMIEAQKQQAQQALAKSEELFASLLQRAFNGELS